MVGINLPAFFLASFTAFFFAVLLVIVLLANIKSLLSRVFSLFLLAGVGWSLFAALSATNTTPQAEFVANIGLNVLGLFLATIFHFLFCLIYLGKNYKPWLWYTIPPYFIFSYLMTTDKLTTVLPVPFEGGAGFHSRQQVGDLLLIPVAWGATLILSLLFILIKDLITKKNDKIHIQKVKLLLFATITGAIPAILFNSSPVFWAYPIDILGELIAATILTYAILKFELVDVSTKLRNIIVEVIFTALLASTYLSIILILQALLNNNEFIWWPAIVLGIFLTSFSQPLKERLLQFVDVAFYRTRYDYRETINKFAKNVGEILNLKELSVSTVKTIKETLGANNVYLFVLYKGVYRSLNSQENFIFDSKSQFITYLKNINQVISISEKRKELRQIPEALNLPAELIVPFNSGEDLVGILFIEKRVSGDLYTEEDKKLLFTLSQASAIALKNALLYQEVIEKNKDIERLLEHEREVNESKDQFVAIASHYLRTPLTTIKGFLYLLLNKDLKEKERDNFTIKAFNEQKKLATLVEDLISISSLEKGTLKLYKEEVGLNTVVNKVFEDYQGVAKEKNVVLEVVIKKDVKIEVDSQKLTQAVSNLVSNALKFTSIGKITISSDIEKDFVKICVQDTGIGIENSQIKQLFQKFHRATSVRTFNYSGSGLGLYITKLIVDAHGGNITVSSKLGSGSKFCIFLPLNKKPAEI